VNITNDPPNHPPDTASNGNNPTRTRTGSRITARTVAEIARICALSHSESEACRLLNIRPQSWFSWKSRHKRSEKFGALLEKFRAGRIHDLIKQIEAAANVDKAKAAGVRFDWRAAAYLLAIIDPQRFSTARNVSVEINAPHQSSIAVACASWLPCTAGNPVPRLNRQRCPPLSWIVRRSNHCRTNKKRAPRSSGAR